MNSRKGRPRSRRDDRRRPRGEASAPRAREVPAREPIEVEIETIAFGGDGVAHTPRAVFVAGAAPGERLRARVFEERGTWARAEILEILRPSPDRREPPCPLARACGGCQWQHVTEDAQREAKRRAVEDAIRRIGGLRDVCVPPLLPAGPDLRYRRRVRLNVATRGGHVAIGFHRHRSGEIVDVESCLQMSPGLERAYLALRRALGGTDPIPDLHELDLAVGSDDAAAVAAFHVPAGSALAASPTLRRLADPLVREGALAGWAAIDAAGGPAQNARADSRLTGGPPHARADSRLKGRILDAAGEIQLAHVFPEGSVPGAPYTLRQRGWAFAQPSFEANLALVRAAIAALGEPFPTSVLELYAGSGNFTLPLAARCAQVTAVEGDPDAARELSDNLEANGRRARVIAADVARAAATIDHAHAVLLDPPRAGAAAVVQEILRLEPERIVYVSCHPATLARDLAALAAGGYRVESVLALDLFPQTYHVETVATCVRGDA